MIPIGGMHGMIPIGGIHDIIPIGGMHDIIPIGGMHRPSPFIFGAWPASRSASRDIQPMPRKHQARGR